MTETLAVICRFSVRFLPLNGKIRKGAKVDYKRKISERLGNAILVHPAVTVVGARGVGKTRLVSDLATHNGYAYCDFEEIRHSIAAQDDPAGFLARIPKPVVLDSLHRVPGILPALKEEIIKNPHPGTFICTVSLDPSFDSRLQILNQITHILPLYSLSQDELLNKSGHFIDAVFDLSGLQPEGNAIMPFNETIFLNGGFAQTAFLQPRDREVWFNRYVRNLVHHDVAAQVQVEDHMHYIRLLRILAQHAATPLNIAELSRQSSVPITSLNRHLAVLKNTGVFTELPAWKGAGAINKATKAPNLYMHDVGLAAWLSGLDGRSLQNCRHQLLRQAVYNEIKKQMTWNRTSVTLSHLRTLTGYDVDIIMERADGKIVGIKVAGSSYITAQDSKGLLYCKEKLAKRWHRGIILHPGSEAMPLGNRTCLLPISALWSF